LFAFVALTAYSFNINPTYDLTTAGNILLTSLTTLLVGSILNIFFNMPLLDNVISGGLAILSSVYIAYDTKQIIGGTHSKYSYSENEYILAAMNLYQDVLNLFIQIMKILAKLQASREENN
jgi:FtsH-binding integral membrane protein